MKNILVLISFLFVNFSFLFGQTENPETIVEKSMEAYNARDLDVFMTFFDEDIEMYNFHAENSSAKGLKEVRSIYKNMFDASPMLHSKILNRIVFDNKVIDYEFITGAYGKAEPFELVFIYEIRDGKIFRTTAIRK